LFFYKRNFTTFECARSRRFYSLTFTLPSHDCPLFPPLKTFSDRNFHYRRRLCRPSAFSPPCQVSPFSKFLLVFSYKRSLHLSLVPPFVFFLSDFVFFDFFTIYNDTPAIELSRVAFSPPATCIISTLSAVFITLVSLLPVGALSPFFPLPISISASPSGSVPLSLTPLSSPAFGFIGRGSGQTSLLLLFLFSSPHFPSEPLRTSVVEDRSGMSFLLLFSLLPPAFLIFWGKAFFEHARGPFMFLS